MDIPGDVRLVFSAPSAPRYVEKKHILQSDLRVKVPCGKGHRDDRRWLGIIPKSSRFSNMYCGNWYILLRGRISKSSSPTILIGKCSLFEDSYTYCCYRHRWWLGESSPFMALIQVNGILQFTQICGDLFHMISCLRFNLGLNLAPRPEGLLTSYTSESISGADASSSCIGWRFRPDLAREMKGWMVAQK